MDLLISGLFTGGSMDQRITILENSGVCPIMLLLIFGISKLITPVTKFVYYVYRFLWIYFFPCTFNVEFIHEIFKFRRIPIFMIVYDAAGLIV